MFRKLLLIHERIDFSEDDFLKTVYVLVSVTLVLMAGLMSGLTLGLLSLDAVDLEVLKRSGTPSEKKYAEKIAPVMKHQHMLLVTLLLCNAICNEALPLFLDRLTSPSIAIVISVTVVLLFGEIIPQAICSRYGLQVGAYSAPFVRALMWVCSPLAYPIGKLLDLVLGRGHTALFRRAQLKALVDIHGETAGLGGTLSLDEVSVIRGALDLTNKTAIRSMTPLDKVFMLSDGAVLDVETLQSILVSGHSRIPVYRGSTRTDIIGLILVKELLLVDPAAKLRVREVRMRMLPHVSADTPMYDMLRLFETGRCHMAALTRAPTGYVPPQTISAGPDNAAGIFCRTPRPQLSPRAPAVVEAAGMELTTSSHSFVLSTNVPEEPIGIITIEDVIEELLQQEIVDETDQFVDNLQTARVNAAVLTRSLPPRLREVLASGIFTPRVGKLAVPITMRRQRGSTGSLETIKPLRKLPPLPLSPAKSPERQPLLDPFLDALLDGSPDPSQYDNMSDKSDIHSSVR